MYISLWLLFKVVTNMTDNESNSTNLLQEISNEY